MTDPLQGRRRLFKLFKLRATCPRRAAARTVAIVLGAAAAAGCQAPTPYVFAEREFDRSSPDFHKEPLERDSVMICMSPFSDRSAAIAALADEECQKYGKTARFSGRQFGKCPLLVSSAPTYRCIAPTPSPP